MILEFLENNIAVFGIFPFHGKVCGCRNPDCDAPGKHPRPSAWQLVQPYSDETYTALDDMGEFDSGYGVLLSGTDLLVIDVDARNGGLASLEVLRGKYPWIMDPERTVHVATGSGDGSLHIYMLVDKGKSLKQTLPQYPGVDFKSSGYVVGAGSRHVSGKKYVHVHGSVSDLAYAEDDLLEELAVEDSYRANFGSGEWLDVTEAEIADYLTYIDPSCGYEEWVHVGMAIHHATSGAGFALWNEWSQGSDKYPSESSLRRKWDSFGKHALPITMGTVRKMAIDNGWTVDYDLAKVEVAKHPQGEIIIEESESIDLLRPPGFVGEVAAWIRKQCMHPREHLAVAAALYVVSCAGGIRHRDEYSNIPANLYLFGVAGSGTGKNDVLKAVNKLMMAVGLSRAIHGSIKSDAEIFRNLIDNKACFYIIDEFGEALAQIVKARNGKQAHYLQGVIGTLMEAFTATNGVMLIKGDEKRSLRKEMQAKLSGIISEHGDTPRDESAARAVAELKESLKDIDIGLKNPYVSLMGFTTPEVFESLMTFDMVTSGFLGRCVIANEHETNPYRNKHFSPSEVPSDLGSQLLYLYSAGESVGTRRVDQYGPEVMIGTTEEAIKLLDKVYDDFWELGEWHKTHTGLEAVPRRGFELVCRISFVLAIPHGQRTAAMVQWAYAYVKRDLERKMSIAGANSSFRDEDKILGRIMSKIPQGPETITHGVLVNRCSTKQYTKELIEKALQVLVQAGKVHCTTHSTGRGPSTKRYYL